MKKLLLRLKPCNIVLALKDANQEWYSSKLAQKAGATYVYAAKLLTQFEKDGIVTFEKKGRTKRVKLTEKGISIANALEELGRKTEPPIPAATALPVPAPQPEKELEQKKEGAAAAKKAEEQKKESQGAPAEKEKQKKEN